MTGEAAIAQTPPQAKLEFSNACLFHLYRGVRHIPIIKRLYPSLLKVWARLTWTGGYTIKRYKGLFFILNYRNFADRKIGLCGGLEVGRYDALYADMVKEGCDVFLDVGASLGIYALQVARDGVAKEIHAFEPDPRNYAQMLGNMYLNKLTGAIRTYQMAVSRTSGTVQFELASELKTNLNQVVSTAETGATHTMGHLVPGTGQTCDVAACSLDEMFPYQGKKIFIKMHIQGHELEALKGADKLLRNNACFVQLAIWHENFSRVTQHLATLGFKVVRSGDIYHYLTR